MSRRNKQFKESVRRNSRSCSFYVNQLIELAVSAFKYTNLPDTIDERFMEMVLNQNGSAVFFYDEVIGFLALPVALSGRWDVYNRPIRFRAYASNGYQRELNNGEAVIMYNNLMRTPSTQLVNMFAEKLWNVDRSIDVNISAQKTPLLIRCKNSERLSLENIYMQYDGNMPVIFASDNFDPESFDILRTDAPFVVGDLMAAKERIWNEAIGYLGYANMQETKKERLISDEVARLTGGAIACRQGRLQARQQAVDQINRMFGLNIQVEFRQDTVNPYDDSVTENLTVMDSVEMEENS